MRWTKPTRSPEAGALWTTLFTLANLGVWIAHYAPLAVLLPTQLQGLDPEGKELAFGLTSGLGAIVALVVGPLAGALSDRTAVRHPWTVAGALVAAAALVALAGQESVGGVVVWWCVAQAGINTMQASITAAVPDRVPVGRRGTVSGWAGITAGSALVPVFLVTKVVHELRAGYYLTAVAVVCLALAFVILTRDRCAAPGPRRRAWTWSWHPDFVWAWVTRFLFFFGWSLATIYVLYYLVDQVGVPASSGGEAVLQISVVFTAVLTVSAVGGGVLSDRLGRRRVLVTAGGLIVAGGSIMWALWPSWPLVLVGDAVLAVGHGLFLAVDQALVTQVLPAAEHRARDLGIFNVAYTAPQALAPVVGGFVVTGPGGYPLLYLLSAAVTVTGALLVLRIRSVR